MKLNDETHAQNVLPRIKMEEQNIYAEQAKLVAKLEGLRTARQIAEAVVDDEKDEAKKNSNKVNT
jgi:hypothetical protein